MKKLLILSALTTLIFISNSTFSPCFAEDTNIAQAKACFKKAVKYGIQGNKTAAMSEYKKAIAINPNYSVAYNNIGYIYRQKGQIDKAIEYYQKAIAVRPNNDQAHSNLASAYASKGDLDIAIKEYYKALDIDPGSITIELALEKIIKKKSIKESRSIEEIKQELAVLYPTKETAPSYDKYMDLLEETEAEILPDGIKPAKNGQLDEEATTETNKNLKSETNEHEKTGSNQIEEMLTDPQVGTLMILHKDNG